jgi:hypothetical protein
MVTVKPGDAEAAIKNACVFLSDMHLRRLEGRDITFLFVAYALLRGATPEKRICAIGLSEAELYPDGCPWGSLSKTLGVSLNKRKPRKPGADAFAYGTRDISVANAVRITSRDFGFRPTRNRAARDTEGAESACSIIAQALHRLGIHMSEDAVEKSWRRGSRIIKMSRDELAKQALLD